MEGDLGFGGSKKGYSEAIKAKGKVVVHMEVNMDLQVTIGVSRVFYFFAGILGEVEMAVFWMDAEGTDFKGLLEVGQFEIELVPRMGADMMLTEISMVGSAIDYEEALERGK